MRNSSNHPHADTGRTRLAPSPTGALHLGNARTFLVNWTLARQNGLHIRLRIDDLDGPRVKKGADAAAIADLQWLGLDWDGPIHYQSAAAERYEAAFGRLEEGGYTYACHCTRKQVDDVRAGISPDGSSIYSGTCRTANTPARTGAAAIRFKTQNQHVRFNDGLGTEHRYELERDIGDFVIRKADGAFAYQLASAVDDLEDKITQVVRGEDLLASTARQIAIFHALGHSTHLPRFIHLPLIVGTDGRKLAKRHGDTTLASLRDEGVMAGQIRAMLARWSGFAPSGRAIGINEWINRFSLDRLPRHSIVYDDAADRPRPL